MEESRQNLKKVLSGLFSVIFIIAICVTIYLNQQFVKRQFNKARGVYYISQGDTAFRKMNLNKAIKFYNIGLKYYPQHYTAWCNLGNIYVNYEDYYSALHAYSQSFKHNPKMMIARMNYGLIASEKLGNFDIALDQYNKVIKIQRKLITIPYIYNNRVSSKLNKAIAYYNGSASGWWLSSTINSYEALYVRYNGDHGVSDMTSSDGVRPAVSIPASATIPLGCTGTSAETACVITLH